MQLYRLGFLSGHSGFQTEKIGIVWMAQGPIKIFQHSGAPGTVFHSLIALPYALGHLALAHKGADALGPFRKKGLHSFQYLSKIGIAPAKTGGAEQKYLLMGQTLEKLGGSSIAGSFVGPEPYIDDVSSQSPGIGALRNKGIPSGEGFPSGPGPEERCCRYGCCKR